MTNDLQNLRDELEDINLQLFSLLEKRENIVSQIQAFKKGRSCWSPQREYELFSRLATKIKNDEDAFTFSYIMQQHVQKNGDYPSWSSAHHLNTSSHSIIEMTNPILVYIKKPSFFNNLDIKEEYRIKILRVVHSKVIAIDGPSGSGKSTVAKLVAKKLNLTYLDTGAMFRAVAYKLHHKGVELEDNKAIRQCLDSMDFNYAKSENNLVEIDGENLTEKIREHEVSKLASIYSSNQLVRDYLKDKQREIASVRPSILEGRDIGTVIFPKAAIKVYLTASDIVRAQRRYDQLVENGSQDNISVDSIKKDIIERDQLDQSREIAPLKKASDACEIDSGTLTVNEVVDEICRLYELKRELF